MSSSLVKKLDHQIEIKPLIKDSLFFLDRHAYLKNRKAKQVMLKTVAELGDDEDPNFFGTGKLSMWKYKNLPLKQSDFTIINPELKGSYIEFFWNNLPFEVGRMRLMVLKCRRCYSVHRDNEDRLHTALITNEQSHLVYKNPNQWHHIPVDGYLYYVSAKQEHTAINGGDDWRVHLVCDLIETGNSHLI